MSRQWLYIADVAQLLDETEDKVLRWMQSGELIAYNFAASAKSSRKRWKTTQDHVDAFIASRQTSASPQRASARRPPAYERLV